MVVGNQVSIILAVEVARQVDWRLQDHWVVPPVFDDVGWKGWTRVVVVLRHYFCRYQFCLRGRVSRLRFLGV